MLTLLRSHSRGFVISRHWQGNQTDCGTTSRAAASSMSFLAAIFISCSKVSLITTSVLLNQPLEEDTPVSAFRITQYCLDRCDSLHTVRSARPHQLDPPAMTHSFQPSRDFRMARAINKITWTQTVQIDAMRQNTLHNTEFLRNARGQPCSPFADKSNAKVLLYAKLPDFGKGIVFLESSQASPVCLSAKSSR